MKRSTKSPVPKIFDQPLKVVNLGLSMFADSLRANSIEVVHVDWRPPAGGDARLANILAALED
jgi:FdrA protein